MTELSWDAKDKGGRYCAPACGRGCTAREHDLAEAKAEVLARALGPGWEPEVWENLGWHYSVQSPCKRLSVSPSLGSFMAFLGEPGGIGGRWSAHGETPQEAIKAVIAVAVAEYEEIGAIIEGLA
ncbi:hypothetical protein LCGC14_2409320 [marine sediment metagenome]|uniref:Uncharacterized protein n=1 Tax=marine sediment metagenome TaxID=412755 RepID=A0A0F9CF32_9ZZZZ